MRVLADGAAGLSGLEAAAGAGTAGVIAGAAAGARSGGIACCRSASGSRRSGIAKISSDKPISSSNETIQTLTGQIGRTATGKPDRGMARLDEIE
jgi:hypothetical protein